MEEKKEIQEKQKTEKFPLTFPVLPLRDVVIFPHMMFPILVGREQSLKAVSHSIENEKYIFVVAQKDSSIDDPNENEIYKEGTIAKVFQHLKLPNGIMKILVDGIVQGRVMEFIPNKNFLEAKIIVSTPTLEKSDDLNALLRSASNLFIEYVNINKNIPPEILIAYENIKDERKKMYFIAANISQKIEAKQKILECESLNEQLFEIITILTNELNVLKIEKEIDDKVHENIQKNQRKFFIQEQIRILQDELGEDEVLTPDLLKLKDLIVKANMPENVKEKAMEEFDKLKKIPSQSPEATVSRNYLDWMISLPWNNETKDNLNVLHAKEILDEDHFGLKKPKERILEHIAVLNLIKRKKTKNKVSPKSQILCLVGPPGVGKTSLGKSIARALERKFVRISLGGVRDEAEIRGHRRTYIGSMPGKILQSMKKSGTTNPVILMDEVDKMSMDFRGDPSAALLEVLDPEQNFSFNDHYLDVDYDLSKVIFITTANVKYNIPSPLLDRMEVIELSSYLDFEKLEIAKRHIIPKVLSENGMSKKEISIKDFAIKKIISEYTREAGVRNLERTIESLCRKVAKEIVEKNIQKKKIVISEKEIEKFLGVPKFRSKEKEKKNVVGSVMGLAWTSVGGEILRVDVSIMSGREKLTLTGKMGEVMKESAQAALSYIRANFKTLNINENFYKDKEIHIHLPEGAIPKDGPSAGVTMTMAMISAIKNKPAFSSVAMTGEITLRGDVIAIGGLNEKLLAAKRSGIKTVIIPKDNEKDLIEISEQIKNGLKIIPVVKITEAIEFVFEKEKKS